MQKFIQRLRKMSAVRAVILSCAALALAACQLGNPLLGEWRLNTEGLSAASIATMEKADPASRDNILTLNFMRDGVLLGRQIQEAKKIDDTAARGYYLTPEDEEQIRTAEARKIAAKPKPLDQGRKLPATYRVEKSDKTAGKTDRKTVFVTIEGRAERQVTIYDVKDREFIIWPVNGVERRYERRK